MKRKAAGEKGAASVSQTALWVPTRDANLDASVVHIMQTIRKYVQTPHTGTRQQDTRRISHIKLPNPQQLSAGTVPSLKKHE